MFTLTINGQTRSLDVPGDTPLLWALRDELGLTGTKYGCGVAMCGACTVHVNGSAMRACSLPISAIDKAVVTTIEGLNTKAGKAVQAAWQTLDVVQCGYCQSGQIMSAAALLEKTPQPTEQQIIDGMNGNLCRCATYHRIRAAVAQASADLAGGV